MSSHYAAVSTTAQRSATPDTAHEGIQVAETQPGDWFVRPIVQDLARKLSYSGAASCLVMAFGWVCVELGYILVRALADFSLHQGGHASFVIAITTCGVSSSILCLLSHGAFSRNGQGAWSSDLRLLNRCFRGLELRPKIALEESQSLSVGLARMPRQAAVRTVCWGGLVIFTTTVGEAIVAGNTNNSLAVLFAGVMSIAMLVGYSYLVTELYSADGRARLRRLCYRMERPIIEPVTLSLRVKFSLFAVFLSISLITLAGVTLNGVREWPLLVACVLFSFVAGGMLMALTSLSILRSFREIVVAADDLAAGGEGQIFSSSLDTEMVELAQHINASAREINATREHLEEMVDEKTEELRLAVKEAWDASLTKGRFLATMSHEIRTPMNAILGMTGLILDSELDEEQRGFAQNIKTSGDTLLELINDVLDFSRLEVGKVPLQRVEFDLRDIVDGVVEMLAERAQSKGLDLVSFVSDDVQGCMWGDPKRLLQVLVNLVGNAIKFTPRGEVVIQATVPKGEEGVIVLSIRDTGIGIDPKAQDDIFQAFSQVDGTLTRSFGGTGLGLAISKELVELMGGRIQLESELGHGAEFIVTLPVEAASCPVERSWTEPNLSGVHFLLVEDNQSTSDVLEYYLSSWGASIVRAENQEEALQQTLKAMREGTPVDIALVDGHLGGGEVSEISRSIGVEGCRPQVVMMVNMAHRIKGLLPERADRLRKPISRSALARLVGRLVDGNRESAA